MNARSEMERAWWYFRARYRSQLLHCLSLVTRVLFRAPQRGVKRIGRFLKKATRTSRGSVSHSYVFDVNVWGPALDKYGAVTHLTVVLYDDDEHIVCGPTPATTLFALFEKYGYDPGIFRD